RCPLVGIPEAKRGGGRAASQTQNSCSSDDQAGSVSTHSVISSAYFSRACCGIVSVPVNVPGRSVASFPVNPNHDDQCTRSALERANACSYGCIVLFGATSTSRRLTVMPSTLDGRQDTPAAS